MGSRRTTRVLVVDVVLIGQPRAKECSTREVHRYRIPLLLSVAGGPLWSENCFGWALRTLLATPAASSASSDC